jgi:DNA repair exonuclease SbcCD ATPase subunit
MYQEMNQQLEEAQQKVFRRNKLSAMLKELREQQRVLVDRVEELKSLLEKENEDVDNLEAKSLTHLFYSVLGKLGEQVEKERREALAAKLKYDQAVNELEQLRHQIKLLEEEFVEYRDSQRIYDSLFEKKKEHMLNSHSSTGEQILQLTEELNRAKNNQSEIDEAIRAGEAVCSHIDSALNSLDSAEGWGTWDLLGGGLVSDLMKHSHIDEAKGEADVIQSKLSQFRAELADVRIQNDIHFETDGFGKFADFFFDGLIADWCMQSRITESKDSFENVRSQVNSVLAKLSSMKNIEKEHVEGLLRKINQMIISA